MRRLGFLGWLALASWAWIFAPTAVALEVPFLSGRVMDLAQLLDESAELRIEASLKQLEADTGAQMAVLTIDTLEGEVLEDYAFRVAETWALGRAEADDGVLLLVVRKERKIRIEVGYGLEGEIPDLAARRIIDQQMTPRFREGDFVGGIEAAVDTSAGLIRGDREALPPETSGQNEVSDLFFLFLWFLFGAQFLWAALAGRGCAAWILYAFLAPFIWAFSSVALGETVATGLTLGWLVLGFLVRLVLPQRIPPSSAWARGSTLGGGGGFSGGGGGFSGGGGSFGGGGSSGGW